MIGSVEQLNCFASLDGIRLKLVNQLLHRCFEVIIRMRGRVPRIGVYGQLGASGIRGHFHAETNVSLVTLAYEFGCFAIRGEYSD